MTAFKSSGLGWADGIPAHWDVAKVCLVARLESGHTPSRLHPEYWIPNECKIPWFSLGDVWQLREGVREYLGETKEKISPRGMANSAARLLPAGTVVLSRTASVGFAGIMPRPMATTQDFANWVCGSRLQPEYLLYVFRGMADEFQRMMMGSTHQTIYMPDIRRLAIPVPPRDEQSRIVHVLRQRLPKLDSLIAKKERLIELLQEKRQALITQAVTKGLDPSVRMKESGVSAIGAIPSHWTVKRLKHISPSQSVGVVVNPSSYYADEGVPFLFGGNVREGTFLLDNVRRISAESNRILRKSMLKAGDLVTVRVGYPGVTAVIPADLDGCNCASMMIIRGSKTFNSDWLCLAMNSLVGRRQVEIVQYGAAQEQFNISHAVDFCFPFPPLEEQGAIARALGERVPRLNAALAAIQSHIERLREYRQALITAAVTGKIDVSAGAA